jgi:hypothetical protein
LKGKGRSYLTDIDLSSETRSREFDRLAVEYHPKVNQRDTAYWAGYRKEPLSPRGRETYQYLDSVGKEVNIERSLMALSALTTGKIPVGIFDIDINRFLDFNLYEKLRFGFGMHTSRRLSEHFTVGGYGAWAYGDGAFKYGADLAVTLTKKNALTLHGRYINDVQEVGGTAFYLDRDPFSSARRRRFMIEKMDKIENVEGGMSFYMLKYLDAQIDFSKNTIEPTYDYVYISENDQLDGPQDFFNFAELKIGLRYAFRERYVEVLGNQLSLGTRYPVAWLNLTRGFHDVAGGDFEYWKAEMKISKRWLIRGFGQPGMTISAGYASGDLPQSKLYNGNGSYDERIPLEAANSFQTMRLNEFTSNWYLSLYYTHNLGTLKLNPRISTPEFILSTAFGVGDLENADRHLNGQLEPYGLKTMEKGYFESGIAVKNLYKFKGILGFGLGFFYRYGPYALDRFVDNAAFKITFDFTL